MKRFCRKVKVFFKSGIETVVAFCRNNKKSIVRLVGKFVIYVCKTIIELILLISSHPNVDVAAMGFPADWINQPLWSD